MKKKLILRISVFFLLSVVVYFAFKSSYDYYSKLKREELFFAKRKIAWQNLDERVRQELNTFHGQAGIVIKDLNTDWQILINQDILFPSASLVKLPIMAVYFYAEDKGRVKLGETITLRANNRALGSGRLKEALPGTKYTIEELIEVMISESDNTAANMLIDRLGFAYLNDCFKRINLKNTNISRKMMDFRSRREGWENFTTASDLSFLLEEIYKKRLIKTGYSKKGLEFLKEQKVNDRIPAKLPSDAIVAHKTGLERGICHDAGIVFTPNGDFLISILTRHNNKTARPSKEFIARVALNVYNYYQSL